MQKTAVVIGAGPAGLTAALELLRQTDILPVVTEASQEIGGISRTVRYKGNRMDLGGHRFFSRSDRVMQWWMDLLPLETPAAEIRYQGQQRLVDAPVVAKIAVDDDDLVMLVRPRKSRIYYLRSFFDYPIRLSWNTLRNLGPIRIVRIVASYAWSRVRPIRKEKSLEDFLVNRFGRELYRTFFKSYTEKVWGVPCETISAAWGAQRIKGLSLTAALRHLIAQPLRRAGSDIAQKATETSLIERFLYPKFGPGQLWERVAEKVVAGGGELRLGQRVVRVVAEGPRVLAEGPRVLAEGPRVVAVVCESSTGEVQRVAGDVFLSTMPVRDLVLALEAGGVQVPANVRAVAMGLEYRDFITVGVLASRLDVTAPGGGRIDDTWIYVQEPDVLLGRLQIFNNWSPHLVADPETVWLGLEYFCYQTDPLWSLPDDELQKFAIAELETLGILRASEVLDAHVVRVPKAYPAYFGTYDRFAELREWLDTFENLYLMGRNGMHKYNNQDHSMLTAMAVVDGIAAGTVDKSAVWAVNTGQQYHEGASSRD